MLCHEERMSDLLDSGRKSHVMVLTPSRPDVRMQRSSAALGKQSPPGARLSRPHQSDDGSSISRLSPYPALGGNYVLGNYVSVPIVHSKNRRAREQANARAVRAAAHHTHSGRRGL